MDQVPAIGNLLGERSPLPRCARVDAVAIPLAHQCGRLDARAKSAQVGEGFGGPSLTLRLQHQRHCPPPHPRLPRLGALRR